MTPNNINPNSANSDTKQEEHITFSVHDLIQTVIANWYWFVISVFVCVGCGYIYILRTPKIYSRTANILVKDSRKGGDTDLATLSDLAGLSQRRNVDNEIYILQSRRLMTEVVKQLGLTVQYETKEGLRPQDLYGQSPIAVEFINDNDRQGFRFEVSLRPDSIVKLNYFEIFGPDKQKFKQEISAVFGDTISTPVGQMIIRPTLYMSPDYYEKAPIRVTKGNLGVVTQFYQHEVKSFVANKQASIITISMKSSVPKKAEDVINTLIAVYEKDAIDDKRGIAESTGQFIDNRLEIISEELSEVDRNIEKFKKDNKIYDIVSEAEQTITENAQYKTDGLSLENQIRMTEFLKEYLLDPTKTNELIPGTLSINSPAINSQIEGYNTELQRYMKLNSESSENNPIIQNLGNGLASTRRSIIATLDSYISTLQIQLAALRKEEALTNQRISSVPTQEKQILDIVRQQKIKEELYLYLLNKREENAITMVITESNSRTIDSAYGSPRPVSPNTVLIAGIAFLFGLGIPFLIIYLIQILDTTIRGRKDIEDNLSAPFLGDIPQYSGEKQQGSFVVRENGRDPVSEAFRMIRSNMNFMNLGKGEIKVIMVTSSNSHAGKTFVSTNLAMTFATTGKKVVIMDLDLRRRTFSKQMGHGGDTNGVSSYLSGSTELQAIIRKSKLSEKLDIIYAGIQPPNPSEMLLSQRMEELIAELKLHYDYIIIDSTPAMAVADAIITDRLADLSIYVVREGLLDRRQLPDIERLYREKKFHNMAIILNGASSTKRHGYGYGYGYSYGYGLDEEETTTKKGFWGKLCEWTRNKFQKK